jgi:predicted DsbA family dithiol-disulfide isomerase
MLIAAASANNRQTELVEAIFRANFSAGRDIGAVEQQPESARRAQISGVPLFVFERKLALSGAQEALVFLEALDRC